MDSQLAGLAPRCGSAIGPPRINSERRRRRSRRPLEALHYQLDHVRHRLHLEALVLCDDFGDIIAMAGESRLTERVAEQAPWLAATPTAELRRALAYLWDVRPGLEESQLAIQMIAIPTHHAPLILIGIGQAHYLEEWVEYAACGVQRILSNLEAQPGVC